MNGQQWKRKWKVSEAELVVCRDKETESWFGDQRGFFVLGRASLASSLLREWNFSPWLLISLYFKSMLAEQPSHA